MRRFTRIILLIDLICLIAYAFFVIEGFESISILSSKSDSAIRIFQFVALIGVMGTLLVLYNTYRVWLSSNRRIWGKLYESTVALACIAFVFLIFYGHLLDFSLHY